MLIEGTPFVIPTEWVWLGCLLMIGTFGFFAQARPSSSSVQYPLPDSCSLVAVDHGVAARKGGAGCNGRVHSGESILTTAIFSKLSNF